MRVISAFLVALFGLSFGGEMRVAVYDATLDGAKHSPARSIENLLGKLQGVKVQRIGELSAELLIQYDAVVLPPGFGKKAGKQAKAGLRAYILTGGGAVISISLAGGGYPPASSDPLFPEVASFGGEIRWQKGAKKVFVATSHPIADGITKLKPSHHKGWLKDNAFFYEPGDGARIVLADEGLPYFGVVVAGELGAGRLVYWGMYFPEKLPQQATERKEAGEGLLPTPGTEAKAHLLALQKLLKQSVLWTLTKKQSDLRQIVAGEFKRLDPQQEKRRLTELIYSTARLKSDEPILDEARKFLKAESDLREKSAKKLTALKTRSDYALFLEQVYKERQSSRRKFLELSLRLIDLRRKLRLEQGKGFDRTPPAYPRIICHLLSMLREKPSIYVANRYLREAALELGANVETSPLETIYSPGKWFADEKVLNPYLNLCELYGMTFIGWSTNPVGTGVDKSPAPALLAKYPAFLGFLMDEPFYLFAKGNYRMKYPDPSAHFRKFLKNLPPNTLKAGNINPQTATLNDFNHTKQILAGTATPEQRVQWTVAGEFFKKELGGMVKRVYNAFKAPDEKLLSWTNLNVYEWFSYGQSLLDFAEFSDWIGFDPYRSGDISECFLLDVARSAAKGKVIGIAFAGGEYTWFQQHYRRHLYNIAIHSDGIALFTWSTMYKWQHGWSDERKAWSPGFWKMSCEVFQTLKKLQPYLVGRSSLAKVALLISERTMWTRFFVPWGGRAPTNRYWRNLLGIYSILRQLHIPVDIIFAEKLDRLPHYSILIAPEALSLTDSEVQTIEKWVNGGGFLISTTGTATCDRWGIERKTYPLAEICSAKPDEPLNENPKLSSTISQGEFEYNAPEAIRLRLIKAKPILRSSDGSPVGSIHRARNGRAVLLGIPYFGLYKKKGVEMPHFPPALLAFLDSLLTEAHKQTGLKRQIAVETENSHMLLVDMRAQEKSLVIFLLDYGEAYKLDTSIIKRVPFKSGVPARLFIPQPHKEVTLKVSLPEFLRKAPLKVFLPLKAKELKFSEKDGYLSFTVPAFVLFQPIIISETK